MLELDLSTLRQPIGGGSYARGADYARQQAVKHVTWDAEETALHGTVSGQGGHVYRTAAFFSLADGRHAAFEMGECSCPVEVHLQARRRAGPVGPGNGASGTGPAAKTAAGLETAAGFAA